MERIVVTQVAHHLYEVEFNKGYENWEVMRIKAINEYWALFKAMRGRILRLFLIR